MPVNLPTSINRRYLEQLPLLVDSEQNTPAAHARFTHARTSS